MVQLEREYLAVEEVAGEMVRCDSSNVIECLAILSCRGNYHWEPQLHKRSPGSRSYHILTYDGIDEINKACANLFKPSTVYPITPQPSSKSGSSIMNGPCSSSHLHPKKPSILSWDS